MPAKFHFLYIFTYLPHLGHAFLLLGPLECFRAGPKLTVGRVCVTILLALGFNVFSYVSFVLCIELAHVASRRLPSSELSCFKWDHLNA